MDESLIARRKSKLWVCISSFHEQFDDWKELTNTPKWSTHFTQVRAVEKLLVGVSDRIKEAAATAQDADVPRLERAMLSGWRVWEFFRSKFAQRQDENFAPGLRAADELAWACRVPLAMAAQAASQDVPREPALVFLNGNVSPIALARGRGFWAESAPGMGGLDEKCEALLKQVPVPLIGMPWHEVWHAPSLTSVVHEAGHVVEVDFDLIGEVDAAVKAAAVEAGADEDDWARWRAEVFADFFAIRQCGSAFAGMLGDLLAGLQSLGRDYPVPQVRMELCFAGLEAMGLADEGKRRREEWRKMAGEPEDSADMKAAPIVVKHLAAKAFTRLGGKSIGELVSFDSKRTEIARKINDDLAKGQYPAFLEMNGKLSDGDRTKETNIPQIIASAARMLYEENPAAFSDEAASLDVIQLMAAVNAGMRRGARRAILDPAVPADAMQKAINAATELLLADDE